MNNKERSNSSSSTINERDGAGLLVAPIPHTHNDDDDEEVVEIEEPSIMRINRMHPFIILEQQESSMLIVCKKNHLAR
jgi:hypothetical protein